MTSLSLSLSPRDVTPALSHRPLIVVPYLSLHGDMEALPSFSPLTMLRAFSVIVTYGCTRIFILGQIL